MHDHLQRTGQRKIQLTVAGENKVGSCIANVPFIQRTTVLIADMFQVLVADPGQLAPVGHYYRHMVAADMCHHKGFPAPVFKRIVRE